MGREPESEAVKRSLKTRRKTVSVLCFVPECFDQDDTEADQEKISQ